MNALKEHRLVRADLQKAFDWYEDQSDGLGDDFLAEVRSVFLKLPGTCRHYSVRFAGIRRVNLKRFRYAVFYVIAGLDVWVLAVLHTRREHRRILAARRLSFDH